MHLRSKTLVSNRELGLEKYAQNLDYLVASVIYLASSKWWWGRTPSNMARELSLDPNKLAKVLRDFPGLFRKSQKVSPDTGESFYSLQARYAQWKSVDGSEPRDGDEIDPLPNDALKVILEFIQKIAEHEMTDRRVRRTHLFSLLAVLVTGFFTVYATFIRPAPEPPVVNVNIPAK